MKTYIVFLRGINVGGQKKIRMADLRACLLKAGFRSVRTYIQSGNIIVKSPESRQVITHQIQQLIHDNFGFDVPVLSLRFEKLREIINANPYPATEEDNKGIYFVLLFEEPDSTLMDNLQAEKYEKEEFSVTPSCIYLNCRQGYGKTKFNNNFFERQLKICATARNWRTMKMLEQLATDPTA